MAGVRRNGKYGPYQGEDAGYAYDGSAARVLEQEERSRSSTRTAKRTRTKTKPPRKARLREAGGVSLFAVGGFGAVGVLAALILMSYVQLSAISNDVVNLNNDITRLRSEEAILRVRYELAYDLSAIEDALTTDGSMSRPQSGQVVYVDLAEPDSVERYENGQKSEGSFFGALKGLVDNVLSYF